MSCETVCCSPSKPANPTSAAAGACVYPARCPWMSAVAAGPSCVAVPVSRWMSDDPSEPDPCHRTRSESGHGSGAIHLPALLLSDVLRLLDPGGRRELGELHLSRLRRAGGVDRRGARCRGCPARPGNGGRVGLMPGIVLPSGVAMLLLVG